MFSLPFYVATSADKVWRTGMAWSMPCIPLVTQVHVATTLRHGRLKPLLKTCKSSHVLWVPI